MAKDMLVRNLESTGKDITIGRDYHAKVDGDGKFRVKDNTGRWSKYSPSKFDIREDADNQMANYGKGTSDVAVPYSGTHATSVVVVDGTPITPIEDITRMITEGLETDIDRLIKDVIDGKMSDVEDIMKIMSGKTPVAEGATSATPTTKTVDTAERTPARSRFTKTTEKEHESIMKKSKTLREILVGQGVPSALINQMNEYRRTFTDPDMPEYVKARIPKPTELYDGGELWTNCITAILSGKHILLSGGKATGKNTLTKSLAFAFQRPMWDMSFHSNIGKDEIIGSETFRDGNVVFNPGMAYMCAQYGGIGVLDEINMAKDSAISVLNSILDDRRVMDVPGYERLELHRATTFIGTMNYGYAGTRPLNEALASRFVIPDVREMDKNELVALLTKKFPNTTSGILVYFAGVFEDLQKKAHNAEISTASVDLRGIISALSMIEYGLSPNKAMVINVANKSFEEFERKIVTDVINSRIPTSWTSTNVFGSPKEFVVDMSEVR